MNSSRISCLVGLFLLPVCLGAQETGDIRSWLRSGYERQLARDFARNDSLRRAERDALFQEVERLLERDYQDVSSQEISTFRKSVEDSYYNDERKDALIGRLAVFSENKSCVDGTVIMLTQPYDDDIPPMAESILRLVDVPFPAQKEGVNRLLEGVEAFPEQADSLIALFSIDDPKVRRRIEAYRSVSLDDEQARSLAEKILVPLFQTPALQKLEDSPSPYIALQARRIAEVLEQMRNLPAASMKGNELLDSLLHIEFEISTEHLEKKDL